MKKKRKADPMTSLIPNQSVKEECKEWKYGLLAALITICAAIILYSLAGRFLGDNYVFLHSDLYVQYVEAIKLFLRALFGEGKIAYSFSFSMGSSTIPIYTFWCMSPWNLIYLLIPDINLATFCIVAGKMGLAAWLFQLFQTYVLKRKGISTVTFAVLYALCGYSVTYYYNIHTLDGIYILPLLIMALNHFCKTKKKAALIAVYAYSFIVMFYTGYILGIFSALVFLLMLWLENGKKIRNYWKPMIHYAISVTTAAAISAVVLLPTALYLFRNHAQDATQFEGLHLNILDVFQNLFIGQMQTTEGIFPLIYCGIIVLLMVPMFFYDNDNRREFKIIAGILLGFLLICSLWSPAYLLMHCFDAPDSSGFRFAYLISFVLLSLTSMEWEHIRLIQIRRLLILGVVSIFGYYIIFLIQKNNLDESLNSSSILGLEINVVFIAMLLIIIKYLIKSEKKEKLGQKVLLAFVVLEVIVNGYLCVTRIEYSVGESKLVYDIWSNEATEAVAELPEETFYRVHYVNAIGANDAALYGYRGLGYFSTFENVTYRDAMRHLGYMTSPRTVFDYGSTDLTRMLFAQKYTIRATDPRIEEPLEKPIVTQAPYTLGLGFLVNESMINYAPKSDNVFENLNQLIQAMTGETFAYFYQIPNEIPVDMDNMTLFYNSEQYVVTMQDSTLESGMLTYLVPKVNNCASFAYFSQPNSRKDPTSARVLSETGDYGSLMTHSYLSAPHILELGSNEAGMDTVSILMGANTVSEQTYQNAYFYYANEPELETIYNCLKDGQMEIISWKDDDITAKITATEEKSLLFTSIPYEQGWSIYVDGVETQIQPVLEQAFIAVLLMPGEHEVRFVFHTPGETAGLYISLIGMIIFGICIGIELRGVRNGKN